MTDEKVKAVLLTKVNKTAYEKLLTKEKMNVTLCLERTFEQKRGGQMDVDTKAKILQTATGLFARKGYAGVSIREVTLAAEVSLSSISYYFNGKEGLYSAVIEAQFALLEKALDQLRNKPSLSPVERLEQYVKLIMETHEKRPLLGKFINIELNTPTEVAGKVIAEHMLEIRHFLEEIITKGIEKGDFRSDINVTNSAIVLSSCLNFYFFVKPLIGQKAHMSKKDKRAYLNDAFSIYLSGIRKK